MEENKKMKTDVNSENVNETNINKEHKVKNKKLTIILASIILLLILAIGVCAGIWIAGDTTKIVNKTEQGNDTTNSTNEETDKKENLDKENASENLTKINISDESIIKILAEMEDFSDGSKLSTAAYLECVYYAINERYIDIEEKSEYTENEVKSIVYSIFGVELQENKSVGTSFKYENGVYKMDWSDRGVTSLDIRNIKTDVAAGTRYLTYDYYIVGPTQFVQNGEEYRGTYEIAISNHYGNVKYKKRIEDNNLVTENNDTKTKYEKNDFSFYGLSKWKYKIEESNDKNYKINNDDEYYEISGKVKGKYEKAFSIVITKEKNSYINSSWAYCGLYNGGKHIFVIRNFMCRENDGNTYNSEDYEFEKDVIDACNSINVKYEIKNEFGSADKTKMLLGKYFIRGEAGTSQRSYIYYIYENNLYRTSLTDEFPTVILADYADYMYYSEADNKIHVYPLGDSFLNNIAMEDSYVVYENIN